MAFTSTETWKGTATLPQRRVTAADSGLYRRRYRPEIAILGGGGFYVDAQSVFFFVVAETAPEVEFFEKIMVHSSALGMVCRP